MGSTVQLGRKRPAHQATTIREAVRADPTAAIRIRIQPDVWNRQISGGCFVTWRNVFWNVKVDTLEEAMELKAAMNALFAAVGEVGSGKVLELLRETAYGVNGDTPEEDEQHEKAISKSSLWGKPFVPPVPKDVQDEPQQD